MTNFKTLAQFFDYFKDEQTCIEYLEQQRWGGTPACPFCGVVDPYKTNRGYKCRDKQCQKKFTAKVGTIYENSKIPLRTFFAAIYLCTANKKGISSLSISRQLGVTQKTAWFVLHRVREMLREKAPVMLSGEVQIDECYIGGLEKNKHQKVRDAAKDPFSGKRIDKKTPVFGIVETGGNVVVRVVDFVSRRKASELIDTYVAKGSTMVTDGYAMYAFIGKHENFQHRIVDHRQGEYVREGFHVNGIENFWSLLSRGILGIYHSVSPWHLQKYCDEFAARYNTRKLKDHERFELAMRNSDGRLKYNQLIGKAG